MSKKTLQDLIETCEFVPATSLVPRSWDSWFWSAFSENAPFTWGDNNRSLVDFRSFMDHAVEIFGGDCPAVPNSCRASLARWEKKMLAFVAEASHGPVYIDLEN